MTLLIAWMLIAGFELPGILFPLSAVVWWIHCEVHGKSKCKCRG